MIETFSEWRDFLRLSEEEAKWRAIPWRTHLGDAIREADDAQRPVLMWVMNGHPAGHT